MKNCLTADFWYFGTEKKSLRMVSHVLVNVAVECLRETSTRGKGTATTLEDHGNFFRVVGRHTDTRLEHRSAYSRDIGTIDWETNCETTICAVSKSSLISVEAADGSAKSYYTMIQGQTHQGATPESPEEYKNEVPFSPSLAYSLHWRVW